MKKQKISNSGAQFAGTPPVQHSEVVLAQQDQGREERIAEENKKTKVLNDDDIEADLHNGSAGAFESTEKEWDEEEE
jgi:hypothetical protein